MLPEGVMADPCILVWTTAFKVVHPAITIASGMEPLAVSHPGVVRVHRTSVTQRTNIGLRVNNLAPQVSTTAMTMIRGSAKSFGLMLVL